jgi:hypothetical protein
MMGSTDKFSAISPNLCAALENHGAAVDDRLHEFFGRKLARLTLNELCTPDTIDEDDLTSLEEAMGVAAMAGISLAMVQEPSKQAIADCIDELHKGIGTTASASLTQLLRHISRLMVPRGIAFYRDDMQGGFSARAAAWTQEFALFETAAEDADI